MTPLRKARGLVLLWMRVTGFRGLATPWAIYLWPSQMHDVRLIRHERKHLEQMRDDGLVRFTARYLWWSVRFGYRSNPYEVEARSAEHA